MKRNTGPRLIAKTPTERGGKKSDPIKILSGRRGGVYQKQFKVFATPSAAQGQLHSGDLPERMSARQFRAEVTPAADLRKAGTERLNRLATQSRRAGAKAARAGHHDQAAQHHAQAREYENGLRNPATIRQHGQAELYQKRSKSLEKRIRRSVSSHAGERTTPAAGQVRGQNPLSSAEVHFNEAGHVSQRTLLAYAEEAATKPTTAEMYRDGNGNYEPSRAQLHADIIDKMLREPAQDAEGNDIGPSATTPYLKAPDGSPTVIFTGGGYASGKGSVSKILKANGEWPEDALLLDPDIIKTQLPEFQLASMDDPEANLRVYSEAWDIAQEVMRQAQNRKLNVVVDGITDTSADEVAYRVKSFTDKGYVNPRIDYVSVPTDTAIARAQSRAAKGSTQADKRMIPEVIMRAVHRDVSATIPAVMARSKEMGVSVNVYDTDQGKDAVTGQYNPPKLLATANPDGAVSHLDSAGFQSVLHKANETIAGVREDPVPPPGQPNLTIDPVLERQIGMSLANEWPESGPKLPQPTGDPEELLATSEAKTMPAWQALLDLGAGISNDLGAMTEDISAGKSFNEVGDSILKNMDTPHVIIAPVKSLKRSLEKAAADGMPGDLSGTQDTVRATVTVPTAQNLPGTVGTILQRMQAAGWKVERAKPRLIDANGSSRSPQNGYGDLTLYVRSPASAGNICCELQINTNPLWWTKSSAAWDTTFTRRERTLRDGAAAESRPMNEPEKQVVGQLNDAAKQLYDQRLGHVAQRRR